MIHSSGAGCAGRSEGGYQGFWLLRVSLPFLFSPHCVILSTSWYMVLPIASIVTGGGSTSQTYFGRYAAVPVPRPYPAWRTPRALGHNVGYRAGVIGSLLIHVNPETFG